MFGLLVAGRPVSGTPEVVSDTQFAFTIPQQPVFSHIGIFLLPGASLPDANTGVTVWIRLPPSPDFTFLGALSAEKQSAIFKITIRKTDGNGELGDAMMDADSLDPAASAPVVVGLSIEPADQVQRQLDANSHSSAIMPGSSNALVRTTPGTQAVTTKILAQRIIGNAFNFLASFGEDAIPLKAFRDWWDKFEKKITLDPTFLDREQS